MIVDRKIFQALDEKIKKIKENDSKSYERRKLINLRKLKKQHNSVSRFIYKIDERIKEKSAKRKRKNEGNLKISGSSSNERKKFQENIELMNKSSSFSPVTNTKKSSNTMSFNLDNFGLFLTKLKTFNGHNELNEISEANEYPQKVSSTTKNNFLPTIFINRNKFQKANTNLHVTENSFSHRPDQINLKTKLFKEQKIQKSTSSIDQNTPRSLNNTKTIQNIKTINNKTIENKPTRNSMSLNANDIESHQIKVQAIKNIHNLNKLKSMEKLINLQTLSQQRERNLKQIHKASIVYSIPDDDKIFTEEEDRLIQNLITNNSGGNKQNFIDKSRKLLNKVYRIDRDFERKIKTLKKMKHVDNLEEYQNTLMNTLVDRLSLESIRKLSFQLKGVREVAARLDAKYKNNNDENELNRRKSKRMGTNDLFGSAEIDENYLKIEQKTQKVNFKRKVKSKEDDVDKIAPYLPDFLIQQFRQKFKLK